VKRITWNLKHLSMVVRRLKVSKNCRNRSKGSPLWGDSVLKSGNFQLLGAVYPPSVPIGQKFCTAKRTLPATHTKFYMRLCNESHLRGENAVFWPMSKFNTGSLQICGIFPAGKMKTWTSLHQGSAHDHKLSHINPTHNAIKVLQTRIQLKFIIC